MTRDLILSENKQKFCISDEKPTLALVSFESNSL